MGSLGRPLARIASRASAAGISSAHAEQPKASAAQAHAGSLVATRTAVPIRAATERASSTSIEASAAERPVTNGSVKSIAATRERGREACTLRGIKPVYLLLGCRSKTKRGEKRENIGRARPRAKGALLGVALSRRIDSGLAFWAERGSMLRSALGNARRYPLIRELPQAPPNRLSGTLR